MKLWQYIKLELIITLKQAPALLLTLVISPFILSFYMSFMTQSAFDIQPKAPEISIYLENQNSTTKGQQFTQVVDELVQQKIFVLENTKNDADYHIIVKNNWETEVDEANIVIEYGKSNSKSGAAVLREYLQSIVQQMNEYDLVEKVVQEDKLSNEVAQSIIIDVEKMKNAVKMDVTLVSTHQSLTGNQHYSLVNFSYLFLIILTSIFTSHVKPEFSGIRKRMDLLPMKPMEKAVYSVLSSTITFSLFAMIYLLLWKLVDHSTFQGHWYYYLGLSLLYCFAMAAIGHLLSEWISEKWVVVVNSVLSISWILLSGFIPFDRFSSNALLKLLSNNWMERIFVDPLYIVFNGGQISVILPLLFGILVVSLFCIIGSILILKQREV